jgi:membrane associated rhomboid family serine protease
MSIFLPRRKTLGVTFILIAVNVAVYVYTAILSGDFMVISNPVLEMYGQSNLLVYEGAVWQLFTSLFIHANIVHIAGNMIFLLIFGLRAEEMFDTEQYLLIYFLSGLAGNLLTLVYGPDMISVGASGAIFGIFGAVTVYARRSLGQSIVGALLFAFFLLLINIGPEVNILAHVGGLGAGLVIGYVLGTLRQRKGPYPYQVTYSYPGYI